ncbi:MAG TPA: N-acetyl-gamma-glutamyl-phosphate reductase [Draconibacterium sp.]|nr:N-acetyl-gamma-glutamyl-phosphate reductase [Draconibacterium sp.]
MVKVGIIGGAGYTAGELLRILLNHTDVEITFVQSTSNSGNLISDVHVDLLGETDLTFSDKMPFETVDVVFLCMGHGKSVEFMTNNNLPPALKVIDLSHDFRIKRDSNPFVYGLPELNREKIKTQKYVANPGCFATGIQLALLPLAAAGLLTDEIHVQAITGSTGAGQKPTETSHFSWRSSNVSAYKIFGHQHEGEILQSLTQLQPGFVSDFNFVPIRGNHTRGIFVSAYTNFNDSLEQAYELFEKYYLSHPFVFITKTNPGVKQVVNTNKAVIYLEKHGNKLVIISVTDNLIKGASGQAVQNMNLMFGLQEKAGLNLKPVAF